LERLKEEAASLLLIDHTIKNERGDRLIAAIDETLNRRPLNRRPLNRRNIDRGETGSRRNRIAAIAAIDETLNAAID